MRSNEKFVFLLLAAGIGLPSTGLTQELDASAGTVVAEPALPESELAEVWTKEPPAPPIGVPEHAEIAVPKQATANLALSALSLPGLAVPVAAMLDLPLADSPLPEWDSAGLAMPEPAMQELRLPEPPELPQPELPAAQLAVRELTLPELPIPELPAPQWAVLELILPELVMPELALQELALRELSIPELPDFSMEEWSEPPMPESAGSISAMPELPLPELAMGESDGADASLPEPALSQVVFRELPLPELALPEFAVAQSSAVSPLRAQTEPAGVTPDAMLAKAEAEAGAAAPAGAWAPVSEGALNAMRGGFDLGNGLVMSIGIERLVSINGNVVSSSSFSLGDVAQLSSAQARSGAYAMSSINLVQNGNDNTFLPGPLPSSTLGTVIQNSLNNQTLGAITVVNSTVNSLELLKSINFQGTLQNALTNAAGLK